MPRRKPNPERPRLPATVVPLELINELSQLRDRMLNIYLELNPSTLYGVLGEIAILGLVVDRAEEFVEQLRAQRAKNQQAALKAYAEERDFIAERATYTPPPLAAPGRGRRRLTAG